VLFHLFEKNLLLHREKATLLFHKRVHGSVNLTDQKTSALRLMSAIREISELIY
jgi:hypothetical protein